MRWSWQPREITEFELQLEVVKIEVEREVFGRPQLHAIDGGSIWDTDPFRAMLPVLRRGLKEHLARKQ